MDLAPGFRFPKFVKVAAGSATLIALHRMWTERHRLETLVNSKTAALKSSEQTLRAVLNSVNVAIFVHDLDGTILDVNEPMTLMYGVSSEQAKRMTIANDFSSQRNPTDQLPVIWQDVLNGNPRSFEWIARRPLSSEEFEVEVFLRRIPLKDRDVILANVKDVTDRKRVERELMNAKTAAERADQEKTTFMSIASHELRTPITALKVYLQLAQRALTRGDPVDSLTIDRSLEQTDRLVRMIDDLLDVSRIETGALALRQQSVDIAGLVKDVVEVFNHLGLNRKILLEPHLEAEPARAFADPARIEQVLSNLIRNALKYSPENSDIHVRLSIDGKRHEVRISVQDRGIGIPKDRQQNLFTRFYRVPSKAHLGRQGLGLGLYISKRIVKEHGGQMGVLSEEGQGSEFYFTLPLERLPSVR